MSATATTVGKNTNTNSAKDTKDTKDTKDSKDTKKIVDTNANPNPSANGSSAAFNLDSKMDGDLKGQWLFKVKPFDATCIALKGFEDFDFSKVTQEMSHTTYTPSIPHDIIKEIILLQSNKKNIVSNQMLATGNKPNSLGHVIWVDTPSLRIICTTKEAVDILETMLNIDENDRHLITKEDNAIIFKLFAITSESKTRQNLFAYLKKEGCFNSANLLLYMTLNPHEYINETLKKGIGNFNIEALRNFIVAVQSQIPNKDLYTPYLASFAEGNIEIYAKELFIYLKSKLHNIFESNYFEYLDQLPYKKNKMSDAFIKETIASIQQEQVLLEADKTKKKQEHSVSDKRNTPFLYARDNEYVVNMVILAKLYDKPGEYEEAIKLYIAISEFEDAIESRTAPTMTTMVKLKDTELYKKCRENISMLALEVRRKAERSLSSVKSDEERAKLTEKILECEDMAFKSAFETEDDEHNLYMRHNITHLITHGTSAPETINERNNIPKLNKSNLLAHMVNEARESVKNRNAMQETINTLQARLQKLEEENRTLTSSKNANSKLQGDTAIAPKSGVTLTQFNNAAAAAANPMTAAGKPVTVTDSLVANTDKNKVSTEVSTNPTN